MAGGHGTQWKHTLQEIVEGGLECEGDGEQGGMGGGGAQEGIGHEGGCRDTGEGRAIGHGGQWRSRERKDGMWRVMEDGREEWDSVGDKSTGRRDGMGGQ